MTISISAISVSKHVAVQNALAPGGKTLLYGNSDDVRQLDFSGVIETQTMYNLLNTWFDKADPIEITDDLGRTFTIVMTKYSPKRVRKSGNPWFHTYSVTGMIVG